MLITVHCPQCGASPKVPAEFAGKRGRCPKCKTIVKVPVLHEQPEQAQVRPKFKRGLLCCPDPSSISHVRRSSASGHRSTRDRRHGQPLPPSPNAFTGEIQPVQNGSAYMLAIPLVTLFMILLPSLYGPHRRRQNSRLLPRGQRCWNAGIWIRPGQDRGLWNIYCTNHQRRHPRIVHDQAPVCTACNRSARARSLPRRSNCLRRGGPAVDFLGSPQPKRIDTDYTIQHVGPLRRGSRSLVGSDLVLTVGCRPPGFRFGSS